MEIKKIKSLKLKIMTEQQTLNLYRSLKKKVIAFNPNYAIITGLRKKSNLTGEYIEKNQGAGILLSQLEYWFEKMNYKEFYKKDEELAEECATNLKSIRQDKKTLIDLGLISYIRKGIPCKGYWFLKESVIIDRLSALVSVCPALDELESPTLDELESPTLDELESPTLDEHYLQNNTHKNNTDINVNNNSIPNNTNKEIKVVRGIKMDNQQEPEVVKEVDPLVKEIYKGSKGDLHPLVNSVDSNSQVQKELTSKDKYKDNVFSSQPNKKIKTKQTQFTNPYEDELSQVICHWNKTFPKKQIYVANGWKSNYAHWRDAGYSLEQIKQAISNIWDNDYWVKIIDITKLLRLKGTNGEDVDRIQEMLNTEVHKVSNTNIPSNQYQTTKEEDDEFVNDIRNRIKTGTLFPDKD